jgi:ATP synthase protein I
MDEFKFAKYISQKANRKMNSKSHPDGVWFGLGTMGLVGWSIVIPTLLGAGLGIWLDGYYPNSHTWTLALLIAGLTLGCANAWYWVSQQVETIRTEAADKDVSTKKGERK